jgi:two-component system, chemotaxis family, protein-glutamate methylesterase/glutaminase
LNDFASLPAVPSYTVVGIASSAGGPKALIEVLSRLPADFEAACVVIQHLAPNYPSHLTEVLRPYLHMPVFQAQAGTVLEPGNIYCALPGRHLLVTPGFVMALSDSERVHFVRPSADFFLQTLAQVVQSRAIGVVLTGTGLDGADGVRAIREVGGKTIAQDEATSEFFGMPGAAIRTGCIDFVLPLSQIAARLVKLVRGDIRDE